MSLADIKQRGCRDIKQHAAEVAVCLLTTGQHWMATAQWIMQLNCFTMRGDRYALTFSTMLMFCTIIPWIRFHTWNLGKLKLDGTYFASAPGGSNRRVDEQSGE